MLVNTSQKQLNNVFERIVKDKNGVLVRVLFSVVEVNGVFTPKIISINPFVSKTEDALCLPCAKSDKVVVEDTTPSFISKVSPYFSLDFLINTQPTRAPAYR